MRFAAIFRDHITSPYEAIDMLLMYSTEDQDIVQTQGYMHKTIVRANAKSGRWKLIASIIGLGRTSVPTTVC